jgi:hypothetical protein
VRSPRDRTRAGAALALIVVVVGGFDGCRRVDAPARRVITASRPVGAWQGTGSKSVGDINSDTGRFQITWETRREQPQGTGTFTLTVRSAVSGRPLQVVVDHRGEGHGRVDFADAGRIYDFLIESRNLEWSFSVDELYEAYERASPVTP